MGIQAAKDLGDSFPLNLIGLFRRAQEYANRCIANVNKISVLKTILKILKDEQVSNKSDILITELSECSI